MEEQDDVVEVIEEERDTLLQFNETTNYRNGDNKGCCDSLLNFLCFFICVFTLGKCRKSVLDQDDYDILESEYQQNKFERKARLCCVVFTLLLISNILLVLSIIRLKVFLELDPI